MKLEIGKMALESLWANKTRSILSMLGIIIGVSTVIAVFAIGQGAQNAVNAQFEGLSAKSLIVMSMRGRGMTGSSKLQTSDAQVILEKAKHIPEVTAVISGNGSVSFGNINQSFNITGIDNGYFSVSKAKIAQGESFKDEQIKEAKKVAILGSGTIATLFINGEDPIGKLITVNGKKVEVIGVLEETGRSMGPQSYDDMIYVPNTTAEKSLLGDNARVMISTQADVVENVEIAKEELISILRQQHKLKESQEDDFRIMDAGSMVGTAQEAATLMTFLLTAIAAITLLVSGIGIMNVMFVTVAERTKEIGIAKAIGGKRSEILSQFLLESVFLSMIGGLIGIGIGQLIIPTISKINIITLAPSIMGIVIAFSFSVLVGVFFGFYPAYKASRLDPVDALRSE